ncbi:hypothetical protein [Halodesulfovibrio aestuarii]|uniref:Uncharacterized protein n=1 Tax=Halodesulfovibrio aestuarii TaxID=126333 RepID=A0ABV4JZW6_9BACT
MEIIIENSGNCKIKYFSFSLVFILLSASFSFAAEITPQRIFSKLNLRTIESIYTQQCKVYCGSYLKDYYSPELVKVTDNKVVIETSEEVVEFRLLDQQHVGVMVDLKWGTYQDYTIHKIYWDTVRQEIRGQEVEKKAPNPCESFPEKWQKGLFDE